MKRLTYLITVISFSCFIVSCGESSRQKAHEEVVQEERTENDAPVGLNPGEEREIQVVARNMAYTPNEIRVQPGQAVSIQLTNNGDKEHNIEFELPSGEKELEQNLQAGQSGTLSFTAPQESGSYTFYCPVDNHKEKGMTGTLIVQ